MSYLEILKEIYYENKKSILTYLTLCLVFSIFMFGAASFVRADNSYSTEQIMGAFGGNAAVGLITTLQFSIGSMDTSTALFLCSLLSLFFDIIPESSLSAIGTTAGLSWMEEFSNCSFGLLDINFFRVIFAVWFIASKLSKSNRLTHSVAVILEDVENKIALLVNVIVAFSQFTANIPPKTSALAASLLLPQAAKIPNYSFNAPTCFLLLVTLLSLYLAIRYLFFFIDILMIPFCLQIPFMGMGFETLKTAVSIALIYIAMFHPYVFFASLMLIWIISVVLLKKAYITIHYFKNIYVRPFFKKFRGYDAAIPLVSPDVPQKVLNYINADDTEMIIPVYLTKKLDGFRYTQRHERWWFIFSKNKNYLCKPCFMKNTCYCFELYNSMEEPIFIKNSLRFFEIFRLNEKDARSLQPLHKNYKAIHFVFSKEYFYRFEKIKDLTRYTDYGEYKKQLKQAEKLAKKKRFFSSFYNKIL